MIEYSIGVASAFIAAGIAILQFVLPNALALVLAGSLSDSHSAVTWSVVSRFLLSTDWPLALRSDTAASDTVPRRIAFLTYLKPFTLMLLAIAAVTTPLGLTDGIRATGIESVPFVYSRDESVLGIGTSARNDIGFSRICAENILCPYEKDIGNVTLPELNSTTNEVTDRNWVIRTPKLLQEVVDMFQSGLTEAMPTICGFFDIQFRQLGTWRELYYSDQSSILSDAYSAIASVLLHDKFELFEGVISDTKSGSIGFRNHSVPEGMTYGGEWEEDILFFEPDVACVNTNVTIFKKIGENEDHTSTEHASSGLVDRGGFYNINRTQPYDITAPGFDLQGGQAHPLLYEKAYLVTWATNLYNMQYLNVTQPPPGKTNRSWTPEISSISSTLGKQFILNSSADADDYTTIMRTFSSSNIASVPYIEDNGHISTSYIRNPQISNPWNVTSAVYSDVTHLVGGSGDRRLGIDQIDNTVGLVTGTGYMVDGPSGATQKTPNTTWEAPTYVCVGATKALIKTVTFHYNTSSIDNLPKVQVVDIKPKVYKDPSSLPIWGMEKPGPEWNISMINPIWGIVDNKTAENNNVSTFTSDRFYIPASMSSNQDYDVSDFSGDYLPAICAGPLLWKSIFYEAEYDISPSYTGLGNLELSLRWRQLSNSSTGVEKMLRLIWTDFATNLLVGSKGIHNTRYRQPADKPALAKRESSPSKSATHPVRVYSRRIQYSWPYAIPALICVALIGAACCLAALSLICGHGTVARLRYLLWSISPGRVFASFIYPDETQNVRLANTKTWIRVVGHKKIKIYREDTDGSSIYSGLGEAKSLKMKYIRVREKEEED